MEEQLSLDFARGERRDARRATMDTATGTMRMKWRGSDAQDDGLGEIDGTIVIGEGERDEAPMLYIGEKVGLRRTRRRLCFRKWTSPWIRWKERTSARRGPRMRSRCWRQRPRRLAACAGFVHGEAGGGPSCKGAVDLDAPVPTI